MTRLMSVNPGSFTQSYLHPQILERESSKHVVVDLSLASISDRNDAARRQWNIEAVRRDGMFAADENLRPKL